MVRTAVLLGTLGTLGVLAASAPAAPSIATERAAKAYLERQGVDHVSGLERVGDYWQATGEQRGRRVFVDLFTDGMLWVATRPDVTLKAVEGPNRVLQQVS